MFKKSLEEKLKKIFGFKKVTFAAPSDEFEQDVCFIETIECRPRLTGNNGGSETCIVRGNLIVFSKEASLAYGFFNKRIEKAKKEDKADLHFYNIDTDINSSPARQFDIDERRCGFTYCYKGQYDPNKKKIQNFDSTIEIEGS